jgi:hypothetical protein
MRRALLDRSSQNEARLRRKPETTPPDSHGHVLAARLALDTK